MHITTIGRIALGVLCAGMLLAAPTAASAQMSTSVTDLLLYDPDIIVSWEQDPLVNSSAPSVFIVPFERVGPPVFDPITGEQTGGAFINPCTAELVDVTGATTISIAQSLLNNGETKITVTSNTTGSGFGQTSGANYSFTEKQQFGVRALLSPYQEFDSSFTDKFSLKGAKSIDNWSIRALFRLKVSTTGQILVSLTKLTGDVCKG